MCSWLLQLSNQDFAGQNCNSQLHTVQIEDLFLKESDLSCVQEKLCYVSCFVAECSSRMVGGAYRLGTASLAGGKEMEMGEGPVVS